MTQQIPKMSKRKRGWLVTGALIGGLLVFFLVIGFAPLAFLGIRLLPSSDPYESQMTQLMAELNPQSFGEVQADSKDQVLGEGPQRMTRRSFAYATDVQAKVEKRLIALGFACDKALLAQDGSTVVVNCERAGSSANSPRALVELDKAGSKHGATSTVVTVTLSYP